MVFRAHFWQLPPPTFNLTYIHIYISVDWKLLSLKKLIFIDSLSGQACKILVCVNFTFTFMYATKILQAKYYIRKNILIYGSMVYLLAIDPQHHYTIKYMYMYMYMYVYTKNKEAATIGLI